LLLIDNFNQRGALTKYFMWHRAQTNGKNVMKKFPTLAENITGKRRHTWCQAFHKMAPPMQHECYDFNKMFLVNQLT